MEVQRKREHKSIGVCTNFLKNSRAPFIEYLVLNEFFVYFQFLLCSSILQEKFKKGLKEKACCCADHRSHQNGGLSVLAATENEVEEIPMTTNLTGAVSSKPQETHV